MTGSARLRARRPGYPRLCFTAKESKTWMPGTRPGMTRSDVRVTRRLTSKSMAMQLLDHAGFGQLPLALRFFGLYCQRALVGDDRLALVCARRWRRRFDPGRSAYFGASASVVASTGFALSAALGCSAAVRRSMPAMCQSGFTLQKDGCRKQDSNL
jgi:hypothetical protein